MSRARTVVQAIESGFRVHGLSTPADAAISRHGRVFCCCAAEYDDPGRLISKTDPEGDSESSGEHTIKYGPVITVKPKG